MTITIEELRKVYAEGCALLPNLGYPHNGGLLAVARFVAERQRAVEPTRVLLETDPHCPNCGHNRVKSSVSSTDNQLGTHSCQMCGTKWREFPRICCFAYPTKTEG